MTTPHTEGPVDRYLTAIATATLPACDAFHAEVTLDATVPNWRFTVEGDDAVRAQLAHWYADEGAFEELSRTPIPGGELVAFTLRWEEHGTPFAAHQVHVLEVRDDRIARDQVWCGGRWPASLLAEMEEAAHAGR